MTEPTRVSVAQGLAILREAGVEVSDDASGQEPGPGGFLIPASEIQMENVTFLSDPYVPLGATTIFAGIGGLGKSHASFEMAARVTRGQLPGDLHGHPRRVIIATAEDALAHTVVPRLRAAGADMDLISFVDVEKGFTIPDDLPRLDQALAAAPDTALVVLDPIIAFVSLSLDSHKDQHARAALAPLHLLAAKHSVAIVAIMHLNKASEARELFLRVSASVGFLNAARSAVLIAEDPEDKDIRIFAHGKHNLSLPGESRSFRIEGAEVPREDGELVRTSQIVWLGTSSHGVASLLNEDHRDDPRRAATRYLVEYLSSGPRPEKELRADAEEAGHSWRTIRRAKDDLGVTSSKQGFRPSVWSWALPGSKVPVPEEVDTFAEKEAVSAGHTEDGHFFPDQRASSAEPDLQEQMAALSEWNAAVETGPPERHPEGA